MAAQPPRRTANREANEAKEAAPNYVMDESVELSETETKALPKIGI